MKNVSNDHAIFEVMALLMLVLVAVSATYYTWIVDLQEDVQTTSTEVTESRLDTFMSEIEVVCYPEYEHYNTDSNSDDEIAANDTLDERFIQEIRVLQCSRHSFFCDF